MAVPDLAVRCESAADCGDGVFCNGVERCEPSSSVADARGCVLAPSPPCSSADTCDESAYTCNGACPLGGDADGDGVLSVACGGADCDDNDAARFPGNVEICAFDGHDDDCDPTTFGTTDQDKDGFVDARCCNMEASGALHCGQDCNDGRRSVHPLASEVCDGIDNDCNGAIDEGLLVAGFADVDHDLRGAGSAPMTGCPGRPGFSLYDGDCDDLNAQVNDLQTEICDGLDNDCDSTVDEYTQVLPWYPDADSDGFGSFSETPIISCAPPVGFALQPLDCDDTSAARRPGAPEQCNGFDDNCNGLADFRVSPGNFEDDDGDGHADVACGGDDCDDNDFTAFLGAPEVPDARDNDCDGRVDESAATVTYYRDGDGDGYGNASMSVMGSVRPVGHVGIAGDCADSDQARYPGALEVCNGVDDDCDLRIDEGARATYCLDADGDGFGGGAMGCVQACRNAAPAGYGVGSLDCRDDLPTVHPDAVEICGDGQDNDCDGNVDACQVDLCLTQGGGCDGLTTCSLASDFIVCSDCPTGFAGTGLTGCTDENECLSGNGGCDVNATCSNTEGSRDCTCNAGFQGDGLICSTSAMTVVIDESFSTGVIPPEFEHWSDYTAPTIANESLTCSGFHCVARSQQVRTPAVFEWRGTIANTSISYPAFHVTRDIVHVPESLLATIALVSGWNFSNLTIQVGQYSQTGVHSRSSTATGLPETTTHDFRVEVSDGEQVVYVDGVEYGRYALSLADGTLVHFLVWSRYATSNSTVEWIRISSADPGLYGFLTGWPY